MLADGGVYSERVVLSPALVHFLVCSTWRIAGGAYLATVRLRVRKLFWVLGAGRVLFDALQVWWMLLVVYSPQTYEPFWSNLPCYLGFMPMFPSWGGGGWAGF